MPLTKRQRRGRRLLKRFLYGQLYLRDAVLVMLGRSAPLVRFTVEDDPPSLYLNFAIRADRLDAFDRTLDLPMPLAPIACVEGDEPFHCLTLNVYRVSGLVNGIRAEWSTYVADADGVARYMVVEAVCEKGSLDPVEMFTKPGVVTYTDIDGTLTTTVGPPGEALTARLRRPTGADSVRADPRWVTANDFIYWRNGICDRTFYDAGLAAARTFAADPTAVELRDTTRWASFVDPVPRSVVVFDHPITFAISPWWNLDEVPIS